MTLQEIEQALDEGHLWAVTSKLAYWQVRRNGKTKLWKRDPSHWEIPVKAGFRDCGTITNKSTVEQGAQQDNTWPDFIISEQKPS